MNQSLNEGYDINYTYQLSY